MLSHSEDEQYTALRRGLESVALSTARGGTSNAGCWMLDAEASTGYITKGVGNALRDADRSTDRRDLQMLMWKCTCTLRKD